MSDWLLVVLAIGATTRVTRLFTADFVTRRLRERIGRRFGDDGAAAYFMSCDWCCSIWIAPPIAAVTVAWGDNRVVQAVLIALTASMAAGLIAQTEST